MTRAGDEDNPWYYERAEVTAATTEADVVMPDTVTLSGSIDPINSDDPPAKIGGDLRVEDREGNRVRFPQGA